MLKPIARMLAEKLIEIYVDGKLPHYASLNVASPEGFTEERIQNDPQNSLLQMILLSAYDRQPFTRWAGGFEQIWGLNPSKESLPGILRSAQLFTVAGILGLKEDTIDRILVGCSLYGHHLASYSNVKYARTFKEAVKEIGNLLSDIRGARTAPDISALHRKLQSIHGIGATIASKLIMYTLRETPYFGSSIHPRELYPAVKPIMGEYHVENIAKVLKERYGQTIIDDILEQLKELGDPFAIDALFYIDREVPKLSECLLKPVTNEADDKERGMSTDNKEALEALTVHLPAETKKLLERVAEEQFGLDVSTLAQVWIIQQLCQLQSSRDNTSTQLHRGNQSVKVKGTIIEPGKYADGTPRWEVSIPMTQTKSLPYRKYPVSIKLVIGIREYTGRLGYAQSQRATWIGAPLNSGAVRLIDALKSNSFLRGHIEIQVKGEKFTISKQLDVF
jgi:hypothetical protein